MPLFSLSQWTSTFRAVAALIGLTQLRRLGFFIIFFAVLLSSSLSVRRVRGYLWRAWSKMRGTDTLVSHWRDHSIVPAIQHTSTSSEMTSEPNELFKPEPPTSRCEAYKYQELQGPHDIRIIKLLPGDHDDDIVMQISHVPLRAPDEQHIPDMERMTLEEVAETLPQGWNVYETWDHRYIFRGWPEGNYTTSWLHPDESFDHSRYTKPERIPFEPKYEALSYTWGSGGPSETAYVCTEAQLEDTSTAPSTTRPEERSGKVDHNEHTYIRIGQNLMSAMRHLRDRAQTRVLWIDGICINQSSIPEKNLQVPRMCDIYRLAHRVVVWLGPDMDDGGHALETLEYLGQQLVVTLDNRLLQAPGAREPEWYDPDIELPYSQKEWVAIDKLLARAWFTRQWIVQEILLAQDAVICCGNSQVSWLCSRYAIDTLHSKGIVSTSISRNVVSEVSVLVQPHNEQSWSISDTLFRHGMTGYSDPRDRIYGLLGLLPLNFRERIRPNYDQSNQAYMVYRETLIAHTFHVQRLELLGSCYLEKSLKKLTNWPSWTPDFTDFTAPVRILYQFAAGYSPCWIHVSPEIPNTFTVAGVRSATVKTVSTLMPSRSAKHKDVLLAARSLASKELSLNTVPYLTGEPFKVAFAKTLCVNQLHERLIPDYDTYPTLETWLRQDSTNALFGERVRSSGSSVLEAEAEEDISLSWYDNSVLPKLAGRRYVAMEEGYIGLGPPDVQIGELTFASPLRLLILLWSCIYVIPVPTGRHLGWSWDATEVSCI